MARLRPPAGRLLDVGRAGRQPDWAENAADQLLQLLTLVPALPIRPLHAASANAIAHHFTLLPGQFTRPPTVTAIAAATATVPPTFPIGRYARPPAATVTATATAIATPAHHCPVTATTDSRPPLLLFIPSAIAHKDDKDTIFKLEHSSRCSLQQCGAKRLGVTGQRRKAFFIQNTPSLPRICGSRR